jgi:hypothetical protein
MEKVLRISKVFEIANEIAEELTINWDDAFPIAIEFLKAESLHTIAEALKVDGDISQSLSDISKAINQK